MSDYVCAIGGINADVKGISAGHSEDSHPGKVIITPGGVARNISENLALLGLNVYLFGCAGNDIFGRLVLEATEKAGVNTKRIILSQGKRTGVYLSVSDESGNLIRAVNDMQETSGLIDREYIDKNLEFILQSRLIILDTNLESEVLTYLTSAVKEKKVPVFIDAVSPSKVKKVTNIKSEIDYLSLNTSEYRFLFGRDYESGKHQPHESANTKNILLRNGAEGAALLTGNEEIFTDAAATDILEPNGAGDAFNSGFIYGLLKGCGKRDSMIYGKCASKFVLESECSAGGNLNAGSLENLFNQTIKKNRNEFKRSY